MAESLWQDYSGQAQRLPYATDATVKKGYCRPFDPFEDVLTTRAHGTPAFFLLIFLLSEIHHKLVNEIVALVVTHHLALPDPFLRTALGRTSTLELHHLAHCLEVRARTLELHHLAHSLEACACGTTSIFIVVSALLHLA